MTTISLTKPKQAPTTSVWPQVDLLPPEVRQGRKLKRTKQLLAVALLAIVLLAVVGWVFAKFTLVAANRDVAAAQADTDKLTAEQAKYAGVPQIQSQLTATRNALSSATATEVLWKQYLEAFRAVTPPNVSYDEVHATLSSDPTATQAGDPLQKPSVGQIVFTARAATLPDVAAWMDAVGQIPGLSDPWFTQAAVTDDQGYVYYKVTGTVQVTSAALAHRFDATTSSGSAAGAGQGSTASPTAPAQQPSSTPTGGNS